MAVLQIKGGEKNITVSIADISGKTIWLKSSINKTSIHIPVQKLSAGVYIVTVKSDIGSKSLKLVKEYLLAIIFKHLNENGDQFLLFAIFIFGSFLLFLLHF